MRLKRTNLFFLFSISLILTDCKEANRTDLRSESPYVQQIIQIVKPLIDTPGTNNLIKKKYGVEADEIVADFKNNAVLQPKTVNAIGQVSFLRKPDQERKDLVNHPRFEKYASDLFDLFDKLGDIKTMNPPEKSYDYILINGSTVRNMRERLQGLSKFVENNALEITPNTQIIFLAGDRDLFSPGEEGSLEDPSPFVLDSNWKPTIQAPKNEYEAAQWVWNQSNLPQQLRTANITFVNAPKTQTVNKETGERSWARPTTAGTIKTWIETYKPTVGSCLAISSQPYVYYQTLTIQKILKKYDPNFNIAGAGLSAHTRESFLNKVDVYMDNLARSVYTEVAS